MTDVLARPSTAPKAPKPAATVHPGRRHRRRHRQVRHRPRPATSPGDIDEDVFRVFRLNNGIYGQRQGGHNQMVRCKVPYGSVTPEQLEMLGLRRRRRTAGAGATSPPARTSSSTSCSSSGSPRSSATWPRSG